MLIPVGLGDTLEQVEVPEEELLFFPRGVVGFEENTRYALFGLEPPLYLLQSVDDPDLGFLLLDPSLIAPGYGLQLSMDDKALLMVRDAREVNLLSVVTLSAEGTPASVNLRAPLAINVAKRLGMQIIPQDSPFPVRYPLHVTAEGELVVAGSVSDRPARTAGRRNGTRHREVARC